MWSEKTFLHFLSSGGFFWSWASFLFPFNGYEREIHEELTVSVNCAEQRTPIDEQSIRLASAAESLNERTLTVKSLGLTLVHDHARCLSVFSVGREKAH